MHPNIIVAIIFCIIIVAGWAIAGHYNEPNKEYNAQGWIGIIFIVVVILAVALSVYGY